MDYCLIAYAYNKEARIYISNTTKLVDDARIIHKTWPTASAAFGRVLTITAMMGLMYKGDDNIIVEIDGEGPIKKIVAESDNSGEIRGDIQNPEVYIKYEDGPSKGKLNVGAAIGEGFIRVTRDDGLKTPFTSSTELQTGEIGEDFTYYFAISEQIPSAVGVGVLINTDQSVLASGGYILQLMPGASEETIDTITKTVKNMDSITNLINSGKTPEDILKILANDTEEILDTRKLSYKCHCSKNKFENILEKLDNNTINSLITEDHKAEIICRYCHKEYVFNENDLLDILNKK